MAKLEHLEKLEQGVIAWNKWRDECPEISPDLSEANLKGANLHGTNLTGVNLRGARLNGADLRHAQLIGSSLCEATLISADLSDGDCYGADFSGADLEGAIFVETTLTKVNFSRTNLVDANLSNADITGADFTGAVLNGANLHFTHLGEVNFTQATFGNANLTDATMYFNILVDNDLSEVIGLETIYHDGPSEVSVSTIFRSEGKIPTIFLLDCGVPESLIEYIPALLVGMQPIQFYSCFISYSSADQEFAERLHADLKSRGVRVWFAPHDMKIGSRIRPTIDESIRVYDKLLLVLSKSSVSSQWVEQEVETALRKERQPEGGTVLFPIRLDDSVLGIGEGWPALVKDTRHIGDFTRWKDHDSYRAAFESLMRDLQAAAK